VVSGNLGSHAGGLSRTLRLLCLLCVAWTGAAFADTYLVLSLIGDRLTVVSADRQVGSNLDRNQQSFVSVTDPALDDFTARVADATIAKVRPAAWVTKLRATDPSLYTLRNSWLDADAIDVKALVSLVAQLAPISPENARLLLIAPYRNELELKTDRDYRGSGTKVAGLGFYVDRRTRMFDADTLNSAAGFLGVFAHFQLVLINLQTSVVEAQERAVVGTTFAASRAPDKTAWNALSQQEKLKTLEFLIKSESERVLPGMLGAPKP
jgi:hypothetical protein